MNVQIRPLRVGDYSLVAEIERQAFPTLWPPTSFKRELDNRNAQYLVAWQPESSESHGVASTGREEMVGGASGSLMGRVLGAVAARLYSNRPSVAPDYSILGFVGLWFMVDEAHITAIAVHEASRGKGIGELLLIGSIELAMSRQAKVVSLEARISNHVAHSLYQKYGFQNVGVRKGYYTDNREDAAIMTTEPIDTAAYQERLAGLREAYRQRYGDIMVELG